MATGRSDRNSGDFEQGVFDNVIPFPGLASREAGSAAGAGADEVPAFRDPIDAILPLLAGDEVTRSPLAADLAASTVADLFRSAVDEMDMAASLLVDNLAAVADGTVQRWPGAPDPQLATDALAVLSGYDGPLAVAAGEALAARSQVPADHLSHRGTATVQAARLVTYPHGDSFELVLSLHYPGVDGVGANPLYLVNIDTFDGPILTAVQGGEDAESLQAALDAAADPAGSEGATLSVATVPVTDALATVEAGLSRFMTDGAAFDAEPADEVDVANHRLFLENVIARSGIDSAAHEVLRPGVVLLDDAELAQVSNQFVAWVAEQRPDLSAVAADVGPSLVRFAAERAGHPRRWTTTVAIAFLVEALAGDELGVSFEARVVLPALVALAVRWSEAGVGPDRPVPGVLPAALVEDCEEALQELAEMADVPIPAELVDRVSLIDAAASASALAVFDPEFVGLVQRFILACALEPGCPFGRGKIELWASGAVYAVAQLNDVPGGWGPLSMDAETLTGRLDGAHSTIVSKARQLRELVGFAHRDLLDPDVELYRHSLADGPPLSAVGGSPFAAPGSLGRFLIELDAGGGFFDAPAAPRPVGVLEAGGVAAPGACFVLYVSLLGSKPEIWRRVRVPVRASFEQLHAVLQVAFDWYGYHLHDFDIDNYRVGPGPDSDFGIDSVGDADEATTLLGELLNVGDQVLYTYDFGDGWEHGIIVEELLSDGGDGGDHEHGPWAVLEGAMAAPPEDSGGVWGYRELVEARADRQHPRHGEAVEWLPPGFDPNRFDLDAARQALRILLGP